MITGSIVFELHFCTFEARQFDLNFTLFFKCYSIKVITNKVIFPMGGPFRYDVIF